MRRILLAVFTLMTASVVLVTPAAAQPKGQGLETLNATCGEEEVEVLVTSGASFWLNGDHYLLKSFEGTFSPVEGDPETFTQNFGQKKGLANDEIACEGEIVEPDQGTFSFVVTAVAVPPTNQE